MVDWFQVDQHDLMGMMEGESFRSVNYDFMEEEEKENAKKNIFMQEESCTGDDLGDTFFSGIHDVGEITVR